MVGRQQVWPEGQQQLLVAPWPPQTSPGGWQPCGFWQRRRPSESAVPQAWKPALPPPSEQQSVFELQISPSGWQPLSVRQTPEPMPLYTHRSEQQLRAPENEQELPTVTQAPEPSQRCVLVLHRLLQQSALTLQRSPSARQLVWKKQRPPTQSPVQQLPFELQLSPSVEQPPLS